MNRETADSEQEKICQTSLAFPTDISKSKEMADKERPSAKLQQNLDSQRGSVAGDDAPDTKGILRKPTRLSQSIKDFVALKNIEKKRALSEAFE